MLCSKARSTRRNRTGLVGYRSLTVDGYTPDSAFKIVRNIILYANKQP